MLRKRIIALISATVMLMGTSGCIEHNENKQTEHGDTKITDTKVPDKNSDYGVIYYTPPEEKHFAPLDNSSMKYIDNEILVVAEPGTSHDKIAELARKCNAEIVGEIEVSGDYQLRLDRDYDISSLENIAKKLVAEDVVYDAYPDYAAPISDNSLEPESMTAEEVNEAWNNNTDGLSWGFNAIDAPKAQEELFKPPYRLDPVRVGLIDEGFDIEHSDLGFVETFYDNGTNGVNYPEKTHGTHVAGTMAAITKNDIGIDGVYPYGNGRLFGVSLWGVSTYSENIRFNTCMNYKISCAELIIRNVKVINMSIGFNLDDEISKFYNEMFGIWDYNGLKNWWNDSSNHSSRIMAATYLADFFRRMIHSGFDFVIVCSAGNNSIVFKGTAHFEAKYNSYTNLIDKNQYPEVYDRIIVVGALDQEYQIANFSNAGERCDIYAPGVKILSTVPGSKYQNTYLTENGNLAEWSGTSMASPHVAGVAAMVWTANRSLTGAEVKKIVCSSISNKSRGYRMVDAYKAVTTARNTKGTGNADVPEKGAVLGFVVDAQDESKPVAGANLTFTNSETKEYYWAWTDEAGHFEVSLPAGDYYLKLTASNYPDYSWKEGNETIHVEAEQILNLDWIKMGSKSVETSVLPAGISWAVEPTITADDILVGDRYAGFDGFISSPYVYIKKNNKYGLIGYDGKMAVEPKYDSFNGDDFYGMDEYIAVYDSQSGDTIRCNYLREEKVWSLSSEKKTYGVVPIGTQTVTYFVDENDNKLYRWHHFLDQPEEYFSADASFVVQKINCVRSKYGIGDSTAIDENFYLYYYLGNNRSPFVTKGYKYVHSNGNGFCAWSGYPDNRSILEGYTTVAFSNSKKKWDLYDALGYQIASDLEPFDCNIDRNTWWAPATSFFNNASSYASSNNIAGQAAPFCATEGYIAAKKDGRCGYLDLDGNEVVPFGILQDVRPVHNGKAWVKFNGKWGVISIKATNQGM